MTFSSGMNCDGNSGSASIGSGDVTTGAGGAMSVTVGRSGSRSNLKRNVMDMYPGMN